MPVFRQRYPDITIELAVTDRQADLLTEQVDVAIRSGPLGDSSLVARKIGESQRVICASPAYLEKHGTPLTPADLASHNCMVVTATSSLRFWPFTTPEGVNRMAVRGDFMSDSADVLRQMALAGQGVVRLARFLLSNDIRAGRLVPLLTDTHMVDPFPVSALMAPGRHRAPRIRVFVDFLAEQFAGMEL